jgi:hypothetical protein
LTLVLRLLCLIFRVIGRVLRHLLAIVSRVGDAVLVELPRLGLLVGRGARRRHTLGVDFLGQRVRDPKRRARQLKGNDRTTDNLVYVSSFPVAGRYAIA